MGITIANCRIGRVSIRLRFAKFSSSFRCKMSVRYGFVADDIIQEGRVTREEIDDIRQWSRTQDVPELTDEQIVNFVLSCDRDLNFTKKTVGEFYKARNGTPELFTNRDIDREELQSQLQTLQFAVFPKRTDDGCAIIFHKLHDTLYSKYNMGPAMRLLFMTLDSAIHNHPPTGLVILFDMKGVGLMHLTRVKINLVRVFCHYLQDGLPVKLKEVHVLNTVYFIDKVMTILKPFIKKELYTMMHFHTTSLDMANFYKNCIPKSCLPSDYGGDLPETKELHMENTRRLAELRPFFETEEKQRRR